MRIWDPRTKETNRPAPGISGRVLAFTKSWTENLPCRPAACRSGGKTSSLNLWDVAHGRRTKVLGERVGGFISVAMSHDDLLAHDHDREIKLKRRQGNSWEDWLTLPGHDDRIMALAFHPHRSLASVSRDQTVKVWRWAQADNGLKSSLHMTLKGHLAPLTGVAFACDGECLVSGDCRNGTGVELPR